MRIGGGNQDTGEKCAAGVYPAVLAAVYDIGTHAVVWQGKEKLQAKVVLWFEVESRDTKGRRFSIPLVLTASSSEKSNLTKVYGALVGHSPSDAEMEEGYDMDPLIGVTCLVQVSPPREGKKWPYIENVMPMPRGMATLQAEGDYDGDAPKFITMMREKAVKPKVASTEKKREEKTAEPPIEGGHEDPETGEFIPF